MERPKSVMPPKPGIYYDVPDVEYHRWQAVSNSGLHQFVRSPKHLEAMLKGALGGNDTASTRLGSAAHMAVLQPHLFLLHYAKGPAYGRSKAGRDALASIRANGRTPLYPADWDRVAGIRQSVYNHPRMTSIINAPDTRTEVSIVWRDKETELLCKTRLDLYTPNAGGIELDLKTTKDASREEFMRSIAKYAYYRQAAMNVRGAQAVGLPVAHWMVLAVETESPYAPAIYRLRDEAIVAGDEEVGRLLKAVRKCQDEGHWPGYGDGVTDIDLPNWKYRQIENAAWAAEEG